jgi:hypothetical protein
MACQALDGSAKEILRKPLKKRLDNPHVPAGELHGALIRRDGFLNPPTLKTTFLHQDSSKLSGV